nr:hypothetical protein [uncultured Cupriavidus sp.]
MDKLQMTVTLSEPELLAYLRQFSGARDRSFMLRMLALRGLQTGGAVGPGGQLWSPMIGSPEPQIPAPPPLGAASTAVQEERSLERARPAQDQSPIPLSTPAPVTTGQPANHASGTTGINDGHSDPLAGLDLAALNDAMARY